MLQALVPATRYPSQPFINFAHLFAGKQPECQLK